VSIVLIGMNQIEPHLDWRPASGRAQVTASVHESFRSGSDLDTDAEADRYRSKSRNKDMGSSLARR
jgi:hypothetical protein